MHFWQKRSRIQSEKYKIDYRAPEAAHYLGTVFCDFLKRMHTNKGSPIVIIPIGTDRSTGDALGPLVGTFLKEKNMKNVYCLGSLDEPVHAANLESKLHMLKTEYPKAFTVAIDACLGELNAIGTVSFGGGFIRPGAGVKKTLPPVGDCYFTAVVNVGGYMEYLVLQNTRLSNVMGMARIITLAIEQGINTYFDNGDTYLESTY